MPYPRDRHSGRRVQYAALPYRIHRDGVVQVRLITSRETRRWVIPKGWPMKNLSPPKAAARETYEEAGLVGTVSREPLGIYTYEKRLGLRSVLCDVLVFPLKVKRMLQKFPEQSQRFGVWFTIESAATAVQEEDLKALILAFGDAIARKQAKAKDKRKGADDGALAVAGEAAPPETIEAEKPPKKASKAKPAKRPLKAQLPVATAPEVGEPPADATAGKARAPAVRKPAAVAAPTVSVKAVKPIVRPKAGKVKARAEIGEAPAGAAVIAEAAAGKVEKKAKAKSGAAKPKASGKKAPSVADKSGERADAAEAQAARAPLPAEDAAAGKAEKKAKAKAGAAKPKASAKKASPEASSAAGKAKGPAVKAKANPATLPSGEADGKGKAATKDKAAARRGKEPVVVE